MSKVGLGAALAACAIASVLITAVALAGVDPELGTQHGVHYTRDNTGTVNGGNPGTATAKCKNNEHVSGGGFEGVNDLGAASQTVPVDDNDGDRKPDDGWKSTVTSPDEGVAYSYAICVRSPLTYVLEDAKVKKNKARSATASCPDGKRVLGGGGSAGAGNELDSTFPVDDSDAGKATDDGWRIKTYGDKARTIKAWAICGKDKVAYKESDLEIPVAQGLGFHGQCPNDKSIVGMGAFAGGRPQDTQLNYLFSSDAATDGDAVPDDRGTSFVRNLGDTPVTYKPFGICR
jgi:hypothetical protein